MRVRSWLERGDAARGKALALLGSRVPGLPRRSWKGVDGGHRQRRTTGIRRPNDDARHHHRRRREGRSCGSVGIVAGAALALGRPGRSGSAVPFPTPVPAGPDGAPPPGQPVADPVDAPVGPPPPPPRRSADVREIANPVYSYGSMGPEPIASLRDIWHEVRDGPQGIAESDQAGQPFAPPPGAGAGSETCPPGYTSLTDPASSTPASPDGTSNGGTTSAARVLPVEQCHHRPGVLRHAAGSRSGGTRKPLRQCPQPLRRYRQPIRPCREPIRRCRPFQRSHRGPIRRRHWR